MGNNDIAEVFSLDYEGRGVAKVGGKIVFIKGAMPSEKVFFKVTGAKKQFDEAEMVGLSEPSPERVKPQCRYFDTCGGCVLQHVSFRAQVAMKQRILEEQLERIGKIRPQQILPPIYGTAWHYRDRARFSVESDKAGRLKMGFQARKSNRVVDIQSCDVVPCHVSAKIPQIKSALRKMTDLGGRVKFVEFSRGSRLTVLNFGFSERPSEQVLAHLKDWFEENLRDGVEIWQIWVQYQNRPAYPVYPLAEHVPSLSYSLSEFNLEMPYRPADFTQINMDLNNLMVSRAIKLLDIRAGERVADLFCGLGNFSLPIARSGASVIGIEGAEHLVVRARQNAESAYCSETASFLAADLFDVDEKTVASWGVFDKMLLDPPRGGAYAVVKSLHHPYLPKRIVYVSCNPSTFARDASVLVGKGYVFKAVGVMNMFAQTAHVESIALFER